MKLWGDHWESVAAKHLKQQGFKTIKRNFHSRFGEIDLIMQKDQLLIFVEVKYRKNTDWMSAEESVTINKQRKIIKTAEVFLMKQPQFQSLNCRFDVVSIVGNTSDFRLNWIEHAFYPQQ
jgi:putative endonuclease